MRDESKRKSDGGFTLVETAVVIAVTAILLSFLLPAFLSVGRIYRETANANLIQIKSARAMDFLRDSVQSATDMRIIAGEPQPLEGYFSIWCKDNKLYYKNGGKNTAVYMEDTSFTVNFNGLGRRLGIKLELLTDGEPYVLETAVALINVSGIRGKDGTGIQFRTSPDTRQ